MEQKDQKVGKYEDGSETVIGALIEVHRALPRPSTPLAAAPSTFLTFPIFLSIFLSLCALTLQFGGIKVLLRFSAHPRRARAHERT